jgi:hypothetical protein
MALEAQWIWYPLIQGDLFLYSQVPIIRRLGRAQFFSEYGDWGGMSRVLSFLGNLSARSYEN